MFAPHYMNPRLSLITGILCISLSPILVRLAEAPPLASGFYRIAIGWTVLAGYCIWKKKYVIAGKDLLLTLLAGAVFGADIAVWNFSILKISVTVSTLLANLAPLWVGLISFFILRKKSGWQFWVGTLIAVAGMAILVGYQNLLQLKLSIGMLQALAASLFYAIFILLSKNILRRVDTLTFMFYNMLAAAMFMLVAGQVAGTPLTSYSSKAWICFGVMGLVCQLCGWLGVNYAMNYLPATKTSIALLSQTVVSGFIAVVLLNDSLTVTQIIGGMIILGGIAVTFLKPTTGVN